MSRVTLVIDFEDKVRDIEQYFNFVWLIDNVKKIEYIPAISNIITDAEGNVRHELKKILDSKGNYVVEAELVKVMKANGYLILYNLVEGSISNGLKILFDAFNSKGLPFKSFNAEIQTVWVKYKKYTTERIIKDFSRISEEVVYIAPKEIGEKNNRRTVYGYEAYASEITSKEISGNLAAQEIRELSALYGLPVHQERNEALLTVKNQRNTLAHGNKTFSEVGSERTIEELIAIKDDVINYLSVVISNYEKHIQHDGFLKTS